MPINNLPFEIIEMISFNINTNNLLNAIQVCKSWHQCFYTFIYRKLTVDHCEKLQRIVSAFHNNDLPGHYVRSLILLNIELSTDEIQGMTNMFPDIDTLNLDWNIWGSLPYPTDPPMSFIHPPPYLPRMLHNFFQHYGSHNLRHLSIDALNHDTTGMWSILSLCPRLKSLKLVNLNHQHMITLGYMETMHQLCPQLTSLAIKCTRSDPNPAFLPQFNQSSDPVILCPTLLESFSLSSKSGSYKWPLWLPYLSVKYPHLQHLFFKHCGLGKDGGSYIVPERVYALFTHGCRQLKSIRWSKITVQHDQQKKLFSTQKQKHLERIEAYENFLFTESIKFSSIVQPDTPMSNLLTSLTIGQPPANATTAQVIQAIGQCCKQLTRLKIQECFVGNPDLAYTIQDILTHCKRLLTLYIKDVHINTSSKNKNDAHPLRKLVLKRSSFTQGVFQYISATCPRLDHVELLGCFQTDRRDQIIIDLPHQHLTTLKIQGLRTLSYYTGCRIRFFSVSTAAGTAWYYMSQYDIRYHPVGRKISFQKFRHMEFARSLDRLDERDVKELTSLVTTETLKAWDIEAIVVKRNLRVPHTPMQCWDPENIYYSGFVQIICRSVQTLLINNKRIGL